MYYNSLIHSMNNHHKVRTKALIRRVQTCINRRKNNVQSNCKIHGAPQHSLICLELKWTLIVFSLLCLTLSSCEVKAAENSVF